MRYDVVIVGGGHNGLVAAAYLARAGRSVLLLERRDEVGGAAVSFRAFPGVDVRLSRYSYLVSLLPKKILADLGLGLDLRRRRVSSYTPVPGATGGGLLVGGEATRHGFARIGAAGDHTAWQRFYAMTGHVARRVFPTLTEPLPGRDELRARVADDRAWTALFEEPLASTLETDFTDDTVRGVVLTDGLIGTFAAAGEPDLRQNRCLLYHVIGNGTGEWEVPVGGMGALTGMLAGTARRAGARLVTGAEALSVDPDGEVRYRHGDAEHVVHGGHVLANVAPTVLARLLGEQHAGQRPEGAQLKVNMVLRGLPRLADAHVDPRDAFGGTFHVNEGYRQLAAAHAEAASGRIPALPPCEIYCHSLTDPSILGPVERAAGAQTLTLFGLHFPARLFAGRNDEARAQALRATLRSLNSVLAEPIENLLWADANGKPCIEAKTPLDLERELALPAGHIFHGDLTWPYAATEDQAGTWGVKTAHPRILLCGSGAVRGGAVSGIPGHNAAMAVLGNG
jgi:phytoene dehydrogenase-like protein